MLDPWAVTGPPIRVYNRDMQRNSNCSEYENNLFCLGKSVFEMVNDSEEEFESLDHKLNKIKDEKIRKKLITLLSPIPKERM